MIFLPRPAPFPRCSEAYGLSAVARRNAVAIFPKRPPTCLLREPRNIVGLTLTDLKTVLSLTKWPIYRASQLYSFLYKDRGKDLWHAHNLPKDLRTELQRDWTVAFGERGRMLESVDKTLKTSFDFGKRGVAETVIIPSGDRTTLCVSSQAGCSLSCKFCHTGTQGFTRNLTSGEILAQLLGLPLQHMESITNIVFMGQGEPLLNWKNVAAAVEILTDPAGAGFGKSQVTISTSGVAPLIPKVAEDLGVGLAVSLHAPNDKLRTHIMPINKTYPLGVLIPACHQFVERAPCATKRITFEYVMLDGVNDDPETMVPQLKTLLEGLPAHLNLIPFNRWPGSLFVRSPAERIEAFRAALEDAGLPCSIRKSRGEDIQAACGQLKASQCQ